MSEFTPGPWKVDSNGLVTGGPYTSICETYKLKWALSQAKAGKEGNFKVADWCGENYEIDNANGRLIAAAPDLLEALQTLLEDLEVNGEILQTDSRRIALINEAITKAVLY